MKYELKELNFGQTISAGFSSFFDNFWKLAAIAIVGLLPTVLLFLTSYQDILASQGRNLFYHFLLLVCSLFNILFASVMSIKLLSNKYLSKNSSLGTIFNEGKRFLLPVAGLYFIEGLYFLVLGLIPIVIMIASMSSYDSGSTLNLIMAIVCVLIWMWLFFRIAFSTCVRVVENTGAINAIKRSTSLTKGRKLKLFGYLVIYIGLTWLFNQLANWLMPQIIMAIGYQSLGSTGTIIIYLIMNSIPLLLISAIYPCFVVHAYFNARINKEGFDIEQLAEQFAETSSPSESTNPGTTD